MAYTQADLTALDRAIAAGALRVKHADRDVTYRSLEEMMRIRALIAQELAGAAHGGMVFQTPAFSKGLDPSDE